jgi:hypothetical protein
MRSLDAILTRAVLAILAAGSAPQVVRWVASL